MEPGPVQVLRDVASGQGGLFTASQAHEVGVTTQTLYRWCRAGWATSVRRGVYAFAGTSLASWHPAVAAALAAGPGAVISHRSAAAIHGFAGVMAPGTPELTVSPRDPHLLAGVRVHRSGPVGEGDLMARRGVWITTPVRTIVDLAGVIGEALLGSVLDEGAVRRQWTFDQVAACLERQARRRVGSRTLARLLDLRSGEPVADSRLEQRVIRGLDVLQPLEVHYQLVLAGVVIVLDLAWPWWKVAGEIDGRSYRTTSRTAHDRESRKLNLLAGAGWSVAHLTSSMGPPGWVGALLPLMPPDAFPALRAGRR